MSTSAADHIEVHWRVSGSGSAWSSPRSFPVSAEIVVDGLTANTVYEYEARAVSNCGAKSVWVPANYTTPAIPANNATLLGVQTQAAQAQTDANAANTELANVASDNILSPAEKPTVMRDYSVITTEQAGIDGQATQYGITTEKSDYDNAISTLTAYLNTLNSPTAWNNKSGDTTITGSTFRSYFNNVYTARQTLLNAIYATAQTLADNAQGTANTANTTANTANANTPTVANPQFVLGLAGWSPDAAGWSAQSTGSPNPQIATCAEYYRSGFSGNGGLYSNTAAPCQLGDRLTATGQILANAGTGNAYIGIAWFNSSKQLIVSSFGNPITGTATGTSRVVGTAPAGAVYCEAVCAVLNYTGSGAYTFTGITLDPQPNTLAETPDGGGRYAAVTTNADNTAGAVQPSTWLTDSANMARGGDSVTRFGDRTADNIGETTGRKWAGESGADITGSHTAADTSKVNGVASSSISPIGALMPAEAGAQVFNGKSITGLTGRTLDNIGDSASRFAAAQAGADKTSSNPQGSTWLTDSTNLARGGDSITRFGDRTFDNIADGASRFAVANIDSNRRALVDFSQSGHISKNVDNIGDGTTYGRTVNTYLNANRPIVNFADTFHQNKSLDYVGDSATRFAAAETGANKTETRTSALTASLSNQTLDNLGDGTTYGKVANTNLTGGNVDLAKGVAGKNLGNIADGGGRYGVHAVDGNSLALIDFSQGGHVNKTADNIAETSGRKWAAQSGADVTSNYAASGDNMLANPGFESNNVGAIDGAPVSVGGHISDGWTVNSAAMTQTFWYSGAGRTGGRGMLLRAAAGSVLPAGAGYVAYSSAISAPIQCSPGDTISFGGYSMQGNSDPGGTFGIISRIGLYTSDASGNLTNTATQDTSVVAGWALRGPYNYVVPAGVSKVYLQCALFVQNTGASSATVQATGINSQFDDLFVTRNDLRVPGSNQTVGDQRNLLPLTWAGARSVLSTSPISFTITSGSPNSTVNFTIAAFTLYAGSVTVNYNAQSITHAQVNGTTATYYLFYDDPTGAGGSPQLYATSFPQTMAQYNGAVLVGTAVVTVASGGGGTSGTGGGGGGYCVADDMFIGEGRRAGDAGIGDPFDCIDLPTAAGKHQRALQGVSRGVEECVRMITSDGCALVCSVSTPFDLPDGRNTTAPHMLGEQVITDLGAATVTSLALIGPRPVTRAHLGGVSYAAGAAPYRRIYSHNAGTSKP